MDNHQLPRVLFHQRVAPPFCISDRSSSIIICRIPQRSIKTTIYPRTSIPRNHSTCTNLVECRLCNSELALMTFSKWKDASILDCAFRRYPVMNWSCVHMAIWRVNFAVVIFYCFLQLESKCLVKLHGFIVVHLRAHIMNSDLYVRTHGELNLRWEHAYAM